jgi:hypothetical protein
MEACVKAMSRAQKARDDFEWEDILCATGAAPRQYGRGKILGAPPRHLQSRAGERAEIFRASVATWMLARPASRRGPPTSCQGDAICSCGVAPRLVAEPKTADIRPHLISHYISNHSESEKISRARLLGAIPLKTQLTSPGRTKGMKCIFSEVLTRKQNRQFGTGKRLIWRGELTKNLICSTLKCSTPNKGGSVAGRGGERCSRVAEH